MDDLEETGDLKGGVPAAALLRDRVATVPPTVALCREICGPELATVAYGWVLAGRQVGASLAAWPATG